MKTGNSITHEVFFPLVYGFLKLLTSLFQCSGIQKKGKYECINPYFLDSTCIKNASKLSKLCVSRRCFSHQTPPCLEFGWPARCVACYFPNDTPWSSKMIQLKAHHLNTNPLIIIKRNLKHFKTSPKKLCFYFKIID